MADFSIGQGDRRPILTATLTQAGEPLNLTGASGVVFRGRLQDGTTAFTGSCTITGASTGDVSYTWGASDTATPGLYICEFVITWSTGVTQAIPTHRRATLLITDAAA
jgi:hypothetical protein